MAGHNLRIKSDAWRVARYRSPLLLGPRLQVIRLRSKAKLDFADFCRLVQTPAQKIDTSETMRTACSTRAAVRRLRQTTRVKTAFVLMPRYVAAAL